MTLARRLAEAQRDPAMVDAALALGANRLDQAEAVLRQRLREDPVDVVAIRMMAELAGRLGRYRDAEALLARALELAPDFHAARANFVTVLHRQSKFIAALAHAERLIAAEPHDLGHLALKAAVLVRTGGYDEAIQFYRTILARHPDPARRRRRTAITSISRSARRWRIVVTGRTRSRIMRKATASAVPSCPTIPRGPPRTWKRAARC